MRSRRRRHPEAVPGSAWPEGRPRRFRPRRPSSDGRRWRLRVRPHFPWPAPEPERRLLRKVVFAPEPMPNTKRRRVYLAQTGSLRLTAAQARRIRRRANREAGQRKAWGYDREEGAGDG